MASASQPVNRRRWSEQQLLNLRVPTYLDLVQESTVVRSACDKIYTVSNTQRPAMVSGSINSRYFTNL